MSQVLRQRVRSRARDAVAGGGLLLAVLLLAGCSAALDWRQIQPDGWSLVAALPCKPATQQRQVALAGQKVVMTMLSMMMRRRIDHGFAPIALRMPNSCVRSRTVMSMMFDTPTMPDMSVSMPITHNAVRSRPVAVFMLSACVKRFHIQMAFSSSGAARCCRFILAR